ncbi:MAG: S8 family serine peptidase [Bacillota bacterium]|nr:S8 family serine peptidase [Bacillota bacterium]
MKGFSKVIALVLSLAMAFTIGGGAVYAQPSGSGSGDILTEDGVEITVAGSAVEAAQAVPAADNEKFYDVNLNSGAVSVAKDEEEQAIPGGFQQIYGMKYAESGLKGKTAAKKASRIAKLTKENELYSVSEIEGNTATIASDFGSCRLIVDEQGAIDTFGAEGGTFFNNSYFLRYPDEVTAAEAYNSLCEEYGSDHVFKDRPVKAKFFDDEEENYVDWSYDYMKFSSVKGKIDTYGDDVLVAILDTGILFWHEAFDGRTIRDGWNFAYRTDDASDDEGHETYVASVITQSTGPNVQILPVKVMDDWGEGWDEDILMGVAYAAEQGADVVNMSLGGELVEDSGDYDEIEEAQEFIDFSDDYFKMLQGPVVVAAGNEELDMDEYYAWPAVSKQTISVSAMKYNDGNPVFDNEYSNYGSGIDFAAPGTGVRLANWGEDHWTFDDGTSFASPHIAAAAALVMANDDTLTTKTQVYNKLKSISKDLGTSGKDRYYGNGCPMMNNLSVITTTWPKSIKQADVDGVYDMVYDGSVQEQDIDEVEVFVDDYQLTYGRDYTVSYKNNQNVGVATMVITGKGNYKKSRNVTFNIMPKGTSLGKLKKAQKAITVNWKKQTEMMPNERIDGYQIQLSTTSDFSRYVKKVNVKGYSKTSKKVKKLKAKKKYYVRVRTYLCPDDDIMNQEVPDGRAIYSEWTKVKSIKTK